MTQELEIRASELRKDDVLANGATVTSVDTTTVWGQVTIEVDYSHQLAFNHGDRVVVSRDAATKRIFTLEMEIDGDAFEPEIEGAAGFEIARILERVGELLRSPNSGQFVLIDANGNRVGSARIETREIAKEAHDV